MDENAPANLSPSDQSPQNSHARTIPVPPIRASRQIVKGRDGDSLGITQRMDAWAQIVASYPEGVTADCLATAYESLPGVQTDHHGALVTVARYRKHEALQERIEQYRRVLGTSRLALIAHREEIHNQIVDRWQARPEVAVRTTDLLQSLRDREAVHGINKAEDQITVVLAHPRVQAGLEMVGAGSPPAEDAHTSPNNPLTIPAGVQSPPADE